MDPDHSKNPTPHTAHRIKKTMRLSLTLPLALAAVVLSASSAEAKKVSANNGGGLRKSDRTLQNNANNNNRAIICASSGGVASSGIVPTAPSYQDCYETGCPDQGGSRCRDSNDCGTGSCCMPTTIYGEFRVEFGAK